MTRPKTDPTSTAGGFRIGSLAGVQVFVDWSLLIIFALVTFSLGAQVFPAWHPEWSAALRWSIAVVAAAAFFASVLAHEMSHALVGRRQGIEVDRITLFLFGGLAHMKNEPPSPKAELLMAAVGPVVSIAIGLLASLGAGALMGPEVMSAMENDPMTGLSMLSPLQTILLWLGPINVVLGLFNLIPGFPLDGGRVFRAAAWAATGDLRKSTRWASLAGRTMAILLMTGGVAMALGVTLPFFGTGLANGLWLMLIGWFLHKAARASYEQLLIREALDDVSVRDIMRERYDFVGPETTVHELVHELVRSDQKSFPVVEDGRLVGVVTMQDVQRIPRAEWDHHAVAAIMSAEDLATVSPSAPAFDALKELQMHPSGQLPVVRDGRLEGMLRRGDLFKWLAFREDGFASAT